MTKMVNNFPITDADLEIMGLKNPEHNTIFESPDGGKTVTSRKFGELGKYTYRGPGSDVYESLKAEKEWMQIFEAAKDIPALQSAVEACIILYRLSKKVE